MDLAIPSAEPSPVERILLQERLADLMKAINDLPNRQRAALIMRKYQELSYAEISGIFDCSEAAARANVYQAMKKLRVTFSNQPGTQE